ncbi:hypothetical protein ABZ342_44565 [Amycolatopsis sp. NPDC005961]|uniref:phage distal tail protein n=1 Tax=Amycolatopsis sp. NPDC005961 TaxID=3156720 RepID=UPI0033C38B7B
MSAELCTWVDVDGGETVLDVDWQATGRFMPAPRFVATGVPGQPGERLREVQHDVKDFTIRLTLAASSEAQLRQMQRDLVSAMDPVRGDGIFRVQSTIGDVREIACRYVSGLDMQEEPEMSGPNMQQADVTLRAYEPYWRDANDTTNTFGIGVTPTFFPIFPMRLTSSQIAVDATALNAGDVEAWPRWTITGPGGDVTLRNLTTGDYLTLNGISLAAGESIAIDTRPGYKTITANDGSSIFSMLSISSSLWSLPARMTSSIRLEMGGAVAGSSSLQLSYRQRYLSP